MLYAGTQRGLYSTEDGRCLLECKTVRDIQLIQGRLFVGGSDGLHISDDDGATWQTSEFFDKAVWQIRRSGSGRIWVGTQPAGLYFSDDNGTTWQGADSFNEAPERAGWRIPAPSPPLPPETPPFPAAARAIVIDRDNPQNLLVGIEVGGIMRSTDEGETWQLITPAGIPDLHNIFQHPEDSNVFFASTGYGRFDGLADMEEENAGILRSDDFGETWSYQWWGVTPRYARPMCIDENGVTVASAPTAFSHYKEEGGAGAMLYRTDDRGESWRSLCDEAHSPSAANFHGLTHDPQNPGTVYVGTDTGEVWRVDADSNWQQVASELPAVQALAVI